MFPIIDIACDLTSGLPCRGPKIDEWRVICLGTRAKQVIGLLTTALISRICQDSDSIGLYSVWSKRPSEQIEIC